MEATRRWRSARFRAGVVQHAVIRVMQPSTLGVAVGFKSVRRGRNKLTATQPWDEDDSDQGASLRKLFSATATNRAASLGKTPPEARKRSSYRVNPSVFGLQDNTLVACRKGVDKERGPQRGLRQGRQSYDVRRSNSRVMSYQLAFYRNGFRRREGAATSEPARKREGINRGIEHRSRARRCAALCQTGGNGQ
jgi:hypothetical protein